LGQDFRIFSDFNGLGRWIQRPLAAKEVSRRRSISVQRRLHPMAHTRKATMRDMRCAVDRRKVDMDLLDFMQRYAYGLMRSELVTHFASFPERWMTPEEVARAVNRPLEHVLPHLAEFVYEGMLDYNEKDGVVRYALTRDPRLREVVMRFRRRMLGNPHLLVVGRRGTA